MIPLTPDTDDVPRSMPPEHCCFCGAATRLWYTPRDVAVCGGCGDTRDPAEVPTKDVWWDSPQAQGIAPAVGPNDEKKGSQAPKSRIGSDMTIELETPHRTVGLTINAPAVFARPDFMAWLNDAGNKTFTWHDIGAPTAHEYSDVVVLVDSGYEGDSSNMPEDIWRAICDTAYAAYGGETIPLANGSHVTVRLTNLS